MRLQHACLLTHHYGLYTTIRGIPGSTPFLIFETWLHSGPKYCIQLFIRHLRGSGTGSDPVAHHNHPIKFQDGCTLRKVCFLRQDKECEMRSAVKINVLLPLFYFLSLRCSCCCQCSLSVWIDSGRSHFGSSLIILSNLSCLSAAVSLLLRLNLTFPESPLI